MKVATKLDSDYLNGVGILKLLPISLLAIPENQQTSLHGKVKAY
jgi:hypothetical protein